MTKVFEYHLAAGSFSAVSASQQPAMIQFCCDRVAEVCDIKFVRITDRNKADLRFSFWNNDQMWQLGGSKYVNGERSVAAGLQSGKWIALNSERSGLTWRFGVVTIVMHEIGHFLGLGHQSGDSLMNPSGSNYLSPSDVVSLQRRFRAPLRIWYPWDRQLAGDKVRAYEIKKALALNAAKLKRDKLLADRAIVFAANSTKTERQAAHKRVVDQLQAFRDPHIAAGKLAAEWRIKNERWRGVPMANVA